MKVTLDQLKKLLATYKLKVIRVQPMDQGYLIETNKGKKILTIWENADLLKWSNGWREELFSQGHEQVERFIINQNKKRFIRFQGKYFVLSDAIGGEVFHPGELEQCREAGEIFAKLHVALDRMDQKITLASSTEVDEDFFSKGSTVIKQMIPAIEHKENPSLVDEVIYANLPLLYKRFRRAFQLWEGIKDTIGYFPASFSQFSLEQISRVENQWTILGGYHQSVSAMHQDTVQVLREIYEKSHWSLASVSAFMEGYESQRKMTDHEWVYILVQLVIPVEVWNQCLAYISGQNLSGEQVEQLVENINRQRQWDELATFVGRIIDHRNEVSA